VRKLWEGPKEHRRLRDFLPGDDVPCGVTLRGRQPGVALRWSWVLRPCGGERRGRDRV